MLVLTRVGFVAVVALLVGCGSAERLQNLSQIVVFVGGLLAIGGTWAGYKYGKDAEKDKEADAEAREKGLEERRKASEKREKELLENTKRLEEQQVLALRKLEPFEELAKRLHPSLDTKAALALLHEELQKMKARSDELEAKSKQMEEKIKPRHGSPDLQAAIIKASQDIGGLPSFTLHASGADAEAQRYARELQRAFAAAGAKISGINFENGGAIVGAKGLIIAVPPQPSGTKAPPGAQRLGAVLQGAGLKFTIEGRPGLTGDQLQLVVGTKP